MDYSRISLRPFRPSDAEDFLAWARDDKVTHYLRWNTITSREEALIYIQHVAIPHPWRQSICLDDRSIGYISIKRNPATTDTGPTWVTPLGVSIGVKELSRQL
ncbi:UNVERIFIED_CONTAM: hypothetical protein Sradi_2739600 [Sesamum radiatum]|uniref:N-acetyltransferase domain-containing protein n=1 Tax=Sesamum radiatum TaxID=300843 RepID=A0AAW2SA54_SESRA